MTNKRHGLGTIEWIRAANGGGCWHAKVSVPGEGRRRFKLSTPDGSRHLDNQSADRAVALEMATKLSSELRSESYQREGNSLAIRTTVRQFGELWTSGQLVTQFGEVRGLKIKRSAAADRTRLRAHVYPHIGHVAVADVSEHDVTRVMSRAASAAEKKLGRPWRQATKFQLYQVMRRLFDLAVKPGRLRSDNPVTVDLRPRKGSSKIYGFLYPGELLALLACESIPLARRVYYALAIYTGLRKGSLAALAWDAVDFEHGTITSLVNKNGVPQIFAQSDSDLPGLASMMVLLKRWHERRGCPAATDPIIAELECRKDREAETLRADLKRAGVARAALFMNSEHIEPLRFHDLRATFVTWSRRAGKGQGWIADRTGHLTDEMMRRYDRAARMLADLKYQPFPDIRAALPELSNDGMNVIRLRRFPTVVT